VVLVTADLAKVVAARATEAVRRADGRVGGRVRQDVELPRELDAAALRVGIATASERAERTLPPEWWMDRSHCRGDV
jgi:hypothetical protein